MQRSMALTQHLTRSEVRGEGDAALVPRGYDHPLMQSREATPSRRSRALQQV